MSAFVLAVGGMHCASCGLLIDDVLAELPGVIGARTDSRTGRCRVELDETATSIEEVIAVITAEGYHAQPVT